MTNIDDMIAVLEAAKRGEKIEMRHGEYDWAYNKIPTFNFEQCDYRIAPKKEMTLVEELRNYGGLSVDLAQRAADRIEQLEMDSITSMVNFTTDELLAELKRRCDV